MLLHSSVRGKLFALSLVTFRFSDWLEMQLFKLAESFEAQIFINECGKAFNASISLKNKLRVLSSFLATHAKSLFFMAVFGKEQARSGATFRLFS